jgi:very-short-patch-repair endonuclease
VALRTRRRRSVRRQFRLHKPQWRDPFPWIAGTEPEKRIFAALVNRRTFFVFQDTLEEWRQGRFSTLAPPQFIPDFVLPEYRVIIDPFGDYHHTLPESVERDKQKMATYTSMGYAFYHPWASDVEASGGEAILQQIPELGKGKVGALSQRDKAYLSQGYRLGPYVGVGSRSVAAANRRRRRAPSLGIGSRR